MAKWGNCDYRQLQKLRDNLTKLQNADLEKFCRDVSKELAARLLALVIPRTPVGDYSKEITVTVKRDGKRHKKVIPTQSGSTPAAKKAALCAEAGLPGQSRRPPAAPAQVGVTPRPMLKACLLQSGAAPTLWRSSIPSIMPAM